MHNKSQGKFIVIDGTDGSGKATQTALLVERLKREKIDVAKIDFPQYEHNVFGRLLRECLDGKRGDFLKIDPRIASTLYAADRFESSAVLREWLARGSVVVADRYVSANQIHQGGKIGDDIERAAFLQWLDSVEYGVFHIPKPDLIIYLHVPIEVSLALIKKRGAETGKGSDVAESDPQHLFESQQSALKIIQGNNVWIKVDCASGGVMKTREAIHEEIFGHVMHLLPSQN